MNVFVAASYSAKIDQSTGRVTPEYQAWLEDILSTVEQAGFSVFCALRDDDYLVNLHDQVTALNLDNGKVRESDVLLALLEKDISAGVQMEIGYALALGKKIVFAHLPEDPLSYINQAIVKAGYATELSLPLNSAALKSAL